MYAKAQITTPVQLWTNHRLPMIGCLVHDDEETGAVIMGDVVVISYRCKTCKKATTVEHVL